jgi:uncharacterized repeat protein (TIGR01451 family)
MVDISYLPQIMVNKTANITEGAKSTVIDFDIEVTNNGNADFVAVDVEDLLPVGLDYLSDDSGLTLSRAGNRYTWDLGRLNSSKTVSFNLTARINGDRFGDLVNSVNATGDTGYGDPVNSSASASVLASEANITVTKSADPASGSKGSPINFTLTVTNNGNATLSQVFVSDILPAGLKYDSSDGGTKSGQYINWTNVGPLAKGGSQATFASPGTSSWPAPAHHLPAGTSLPQTARATSPMRQLIQRATGRSATFRSAPTRSPSSSKMAGYRSLPKAATTWFWITSAFLTSTSPMI